MAVKEYYSSNDFSKFKVKLIPKGKTVKVRRIKEGHIPEVTEFNFAIVEFGNFFDYVKDKTVPVSQRCLKSLERFRILAYEYPRVVGQAMEKITRLANPLEAQKHKKSENRFQYQKALGEVCSIMAQEAWREGIDGTLGFLMERGALLTGAFYNYPSDYVARIVAKRLDYENGEFGLGLSDFRPPRNLKRFRKLHIQEDCIATGDSIAGSILVLKNKGIVFDEVQIDAVAATQKGVEFIQRYLKYLGIKKVMVKVGGLCFRLGEHFYLRRTKEEGYKRDEFFVGDMGEWSRKLPVSYDKKAWWNKNRSD